MKYPGNVSDVIYKNLIEESAADLYENAPCGYISTLPDGTIIKINQTLLNWLGYACEEVLNTLNFRNLLNIGGKIFFETHHMPLLHMQGFVNELNYNFVRKDRTSFPALINSVEVKNGDGEALLIRTTIFNITDRKKYELELLYAKKKAEEATKVKAEFLSTISHELRTPMNALIGITNLLFDTDPKPEQVEYLNILKFSSEHLMNLINNILDFSKIESGKVILEEKEFNIRELIKSIQFSLGIKAKEKGLQVRLYMDEKLPALLIGDPLKISQVLTNLIGNAIKFTEKGLVAIELHVQQLKGENISVNFSVADTGIGIPLDKQQTIFEEFTQASYAINQQYGGTGLGLSISRKLLALYNSKLMVESEPGKGATFYFTLPLKVSPKQIDFYPPRITDTFNIRSIKGLKILVAEDNEVNVFVLSKFLNNWEVEFDLAENGRAALEQVTKKDYDLVLMDLQMPEMNGYEASREIRNLTGSKYQELPIIALSASSETDLPEKLQVAGITDFVSKPFNPQDLYNKMGAYIPKKSNLLAEEQPDPVTGNSLTTSLTPPVNLSQFANLTNNDTDELKHLIRLSIRDFVSFQGSFKSALQTRNKALADQLAHKSRMMVSLLEARKLEALIQKSIGLLKEEKVTEALVLQITQALDNELCAVINELKKASH